jgi:anhydro-N-acetylmuramic acid kinase
MADSKTKQLYLGIISGTSADGIDTALIDAQQDQVDMVATKTWSLPEPIRDEIIALSQPCTNELARSCQLDRQLGELFAQAALDTIKLAGLTPKEISGIGSHGQTLRHFPPQPITTTDTDPTNDKPSSAANPLNTGTTLQIGDPNIIALRTGVTTVADFRRMDMASGGQGAPLAPLFHDHCFRQAGQSRIILNIGGISNVTLLQPGKTVSGFDTGPGNGLMDAWCKRHCNKSYDHNGDWANSGKAIPDLIEACLSDPYFQLPPPKSTGREYFHLPWLETRYPGLDTLAPADVQNSLVQVTATSIAKALGSVSKSAQVYLCGGGALNSALCSALTTALGNDYSLAPLSELGIDGDFVEAATFAWLAEQRLQHKSVPLKNLTGGTQDCVLGSVYHGDCPSNK